MLVLEFVIEGNVDRLAQLLKNDDLSTNIMKTWLAIWYAIPGACLVNIHDMNMYIEHE
jgi:hypothetical protein